MHRKLKLNPTRANWATNRKVAPTFKGDRLHPPVGVGVRYALGLDKLVKRMTTETKREVTKLFEADVAAAHFGQDASIASQARILLNRLAAKFQALFADHAKGLAEGMIAGVDKAGAVTLGSSLSKLSGGLSLKMDISNPALNNIRTASVVENVGLIKSIAGEYLDKVRGSVMRSITTGNGLQDLVPALAKYEGQTERRAANIALDQTRKAYNSINKGRMQAVGVKKFMWHHSGGGAHPRESHIEMDGQVYSFDDLPQIDESGEVGIPGQAINCRCTMSPVFDFEDDSGSDKNANGNGD